ncbi:MAG: hypothetical protein ABIH92_01985 [Nanoarchaeota archaeon]
MAKKQASKNVHKNLNYVFVAVIILLLIVIVFQASTEDVDVDSQMGDSGDDSQVGSVEETVSLDYCGQNVVPERIVFKTTRLDVEGAKREYGMIVSTWKDGAPITRTPIAYGEVKQRCQKGLASEGQNGDYYYCDNLYYARTDVTLDGEDGETVEYLVDLVLDSQDYLLMHHHQEGWASTIDLRVANKVVEYDCEEV